MNAEDLEDLISRRQSLLNLQKHPGWEALQEVALAQIEGRKTEELAYDISSSADLFELTKLKSERRALQLFLDLPGTMAETLKEDIEELENAAERSWSD